MSSNLLCLWLTLSHRHPLPLAQHPNYRKDVAKSLLVCGVLYPERHASVVETSSLAALAVAKVTTLTLDRSKDHDGSVKAGRPGTKFIKGK